MPSKLNNLPTDIILYEINKHLVEIDRQLLRKTCKFFSSIFKYDRIRFDNTDFELIHMKIYKKYWTHSTMISVVERGKLDCLKYMRSKKGGECKWNSETTKYAARSGHLNCLKYAHENGCQWDYWTHVWAIMNGNLKCLKYAHENGCPWEPWIPVVAAEKGNLE